MSDNYETNAGSGGLTFRSFDDGTVQWPAGVCAWATTVGTPDVLVPVTLANGLPVQPGTSTTWRVDNAGTFVTQVDGAALTALQLLDNLVLAEDTAHASGNPGVQVLAVRNDNGGSLADTDGDYAPLALTSDGLLRVAVGNTASVSISGSVDLGAQGVHDLGAGTAVVQLGGYASAAAPTAVSEDADAVRLWALLNGSLVCNLAVGGTLVAGGAGLPVDTELGAAAAITSDNVAAPTAPTIYSFGLVYDGANWDRMPGTTADGILVNLGSNNDVDTELPAAAALADGAANPTAPAVGASLLSFNGTTWDRVRGDTTNGLDVDVTRLPALAAGTNNIGDVDVLTVGGQTPTFGAGAVAAGTQRTTLASDDPAVALLTTIDADTGGILTAVQLIDNAIAGNEMQVDVVAALPAGTNHIGTVQDVPATSGGLTPFRSIDLDETEEEVKATAGQLYSIHAMNLHETDTRFLKIYNATAANVTVGTTTPVLTIPIAGGTLGFVWNIDKGLVFDTAITVAATTGIADNDTGAPGANEVVVNIGYK